jgi:hypothetical protein
MGNILDLKIDMIVNLMEIKELKRFTPYHHALRLVNPNLIINTFPIRDMDISAKGVLEKILTQIDQNLEK